MCKEDTNIELQDGRHTIFVNATGVTDNQKLQEFLEYIKSGTVSNSFHMKRHVFLRMNKTCKFV